MKYDFDDLYEGPRFQNRAKRRKIKLIVTGVVTLIGLIVLIGIFNIFSGGNEQVAVEESVDTEQIDSNADEFASDVETDEGSVINEEPNENQDGSEDLEVGEETSNNPIETEKHATGEVATEQNQETPSAIGDRNLSPSANEQDGDLVIDTIEKNWKPVGTTQEGEHFTDFTKGSQDWTEMMEAVSAATGLAKDDMIVWWMGNGGGPSKATSTVSTKDQQTYYRVQLEWVDNTKGWKPVLVEQLKENDHKPEATATTDAAEDGPMNNEQINDAN